MRLTSPYERIQELIHVLDLNPSIEQIVNFLSKHLDPAGEISGIAWKTVNTEGLFDHGYMAGFKTHMDMSVKVYITDDNPISESLRRGRMQMWDMQSMFESYSDSIHRNNLEGYLTGISLPLTKDCVVGCALNRTVEELLEFEGYFECMRLVLAQWQARQDFAQTTVAQAVTKESNKLTSRQEVILELIKKSLTNAGIAQELGFSESLIRQETIIIYRKLGVDGRKALLITKADPNPDPESGQANVHLLRTTS